MAITIRNAILHVLYGAGKSAVLSETELDIDSETCEVFILKHVKKLFDSSIVRKATFKPSSEVYKYLLDYNNFIKTTHILTEIFNSKKPSNIEPCDLLFAKIIHKTGVYMAILKLGYQEVYTHNISNSDNQIKKHMALPNGKVEYAALIELNGTSMPINIIEKPVIVDGESILYFSELFLECETSLSQKEQAILLNEANEEFVMEYYKRDPALSAKINTAISQENEIISIENIAEKVFNDSDIKEKYVNTIQEAGLSDEMPLENKVIKQQFGTQRIKGENGIEIKFPSELVANENELEIKQHNDGTVTVTIKRLRIV